jgi:hypothetical protein
MLGDINGLICVVHGPTPRVDHFCAQRVGLFLLVIVSEDQ